jgi:cytochrome c
MEDNARDTRGEAMKILDAHRSGLHVLLAVFAITSYGATTFAFGAGDPTRGATAFQVCMACHLTKAGAQLTGPSLAKIWQHKAGTVAGFRRYSDAMKHVDLVWTDATLDQWLADPGKLIPGTSMTFQGLRESNTRQDVIAYLKAVAEGKAPTGAHGGGMMMDMTPVREDLKKAPPQGQVTAISYCDDTYVVKTADGTTNRVWEFNLRLKTDSSALGPSPGKPVIVGAGMQGDRASVVFASPREISSYIHQECAEQK